MDQDHLRFSKEIECFV